MTTKNIAPKSSTKPVAKKVTPIKKPLKGTMDYATAMEKIDQAAEKQIATLFAKADKATKERVKETAKLLTDMVKKSKNFKYRAAGVLRRWGIDNDEGPNVHPKSIEELETNLKFTDDAVKQVEELMYATHLVEDNMRAIRSLLKGQITAKVELIQKIKEEAQQKKDLVNAQGDDAAHDGEDQMKELRDAALDHRGQP